MQQASNCWTLTLVQGHVCRSLNAVPSRSPLNLSEPWFSYKLGVSNNYTYLGGYCPPAHFQCAVSNLTHALGRGLSERSCVPEGPVPTRSMRKYMASV